ncbi:MAG TPA: hypothetical protein VMU65_16185 [Candidatus Saccharimonadales bacterium]|nr:hypothetical protein [Candidatus Saccharimonadales bacterium]
MIDLPRIPAPTGRPRHRKVPEVTPAFWTTKVLTTGMGEATSDYLVHQILPVVAVALGAVGLGAALALQFAARRYNPWIYWLAVALVAIFGTMAADFLHIELRIAYVVSTVFFAIALAAVFAVWYGVERTLSIHTINSPRREAFYWLTVMTTFALGTAAGDMTATTLHLGYFVSGILFTALIAVPAIAHRWLGLNAVVSFWFAYILTRPLGASFADWLGVSHQRGGLSWGTGAVSIGAAILIAGAVAYLAATQPASPDGARAK